MPSISSLTAGLERHVPSVKLVRDEAGVWFLEGTLDDVVARVKVPSDLVCAIAAADMHELKRLMPEVVTKMRRIFLDKCGSSIKWDL